MNVYLTLIIICAIIWYIWSTTAQKKQIIPPASAPTKPPKMIITKRIQSGGNNGTGYVFFDIQIGNTQAPGRIVMELFDSMTPRTCANFRQLCTGEANHQSMERFQMSFKGTPFHRVIRGFMIQGGDITNGDGTGGFSIFGPKFGDESFALAHDTPGLLSMANSGPDTNSSQFFITTAPAPHLDGKHVVFGRVISGMDIVSLIESQQTDHSDRPIQPCIISNCGIL